MAGCDIRVMEPSTARPKTADVIRDQMRKRQRTARPYLVVPTQKLSTMAGSAPGGIGQAVPKMFAFVVKVAHVPAMGNQMAGEIGGCGTGLKTALFDDATRALLADIGGMNGFKMAGLSLADSPDALVRGAGILKAQQGDGGAHGVVTLHGRLILTAAKSSPPVR